MTSQLEETTARFRACLLGGAIGDALGAPVEFETLTTIRARFGSAGVTDFETAFGRRGAITDDTQMTLFTAEGVLRAYSRWCSRGICSPPGVIHRAYLRWLLTQGETTRASVVPQEGWPDGWLIQDQRLFSRRAPGVTCLTALRTTEHAGAPAQNDSKGCGTVMRVAPIGLVCSASQEGGSPAFDLAASSSALTHGHPTGILAGGAFALVVAHLVDGAPLARAVEETRAFVAARPSSDETTRALDAALRLAASGGEPTPERVEQLGAGWVAEEALAIALYCALVARSFEHGVLLAVNHSGDSDSTGSMAGQLLGLMLGMDALPARWLTRVELRDVIETVAEDLAVMSCGKWDATRNWERYPGF